MTKIAFIIDESSSMSGMRDKVISLINEQQQELKKHKAEVFFYKFNSVSKKIRSEKSKSLTPFTKDDYNPNGCTALYDAVYDAYKEMTSNDKKNTRYLFIIISDGEENSSRRTYSELKEVLNSELAKTKCTFTYLGGTQDLSDLAVREYGFSFSNTMVFMPDFKDNSRIMCRSLNNYLASDSLKLENFYAETHS